MLSVRRLLERFRSGGGDLVGGGERVDIDARRSTPFEKFDLYQKSHFRRYEFACAELGAGRRCADLACGSGYGSVMLAERFERVVGVDLDAAVVHEIRERYRQIPNVEFRNANLLDLAFDSELDAIVSFETVEHLPEPAIPRVFEIFQRGLTPGGRLVFSVPFLQPEPTADQDPGFHLTFEIDEKKVEHWLAVAGLTLEGYRYQSYATHAIESSLADKDFLICLARKS